MSREPKNTAQGASSSAEGSAFGVTTALGTPEAVRGSEGASDEGERDGALEADELRDDFDPNGVAVVQFPPEMIAELRRRGLPRVPTGDFTKGAKEYEELRRAVDARRQEPAPTPASKTPPSPDAPTVDAPAVEAPAGELDRDAV